MNGEPKPDDARAADVQLERWLGRTLGWGTVLATVLLAIGLLCNLAGIAPVRASTLSHVGLMVLMATPVARVVISVLEYAHQKDWTFLALTLTVLAMLAVSFLAGVG
jgi:uncharacterized membrane protein